MELEEMEKWFFEVWNEPDLDFFFAGSQEDYFLLYEHTARAVKSAGKNLKVGGLATANNEWIPDLISYCEKNSVPLDFISHIIILQMTRTGMRTCIWTISSEKKST